MVKPKRLGHLVLRVMDITRSESFYTEVLGLHVTSRVSDSMVFMSASKYASHELALMSSGPNATRPDDQQAGLYHFAWEMESLSDLQSIYQELKAKGISIAGIGDHGISIGVYFFDPDGNEIEVFYELPKEQWPTNNIFQGKFPGSLE